MIDPKSLRIGNRYVHKHGKGHTEIVIDESLIGRIFSDSDLEYALDDFEPIPLSPSLLERAGFERLNGSYYERDGIGFIVGYAVDGTFVIGNSFGPRHCHFYQFHDLQNIFRDLTGQELELKPLP